MHNYEHYKTQLEYIETTRISGYALFALEDYPYVVRSNKETDLLVIEIFKIEDQNTREHIHRLELEAGYVFEWIDVEGKKVGIYLFERPTNNSRVESGDWVEFFGVKHR